MFKKIFKSIMESLKKESSEEVFKNKEPVQENKTRKSYVDNFELPTSNDNGRSFLINVMTNHPTWLKNVPENIKNDRELILTVLSQSPLALIYASEELKKDRDIVLFAVSKEALALMCASEEMQNNKEVVMTAISQNGLALKYASEELKNDRDVVLQAALNNPFSLMEASEALQNDKELLLLLKRVKRPILLQYVNWYEDRMNFFSSTYEQQKLMENNVPDIQVKGKARQF